MRAEEARPCRSLRRPRRSSISSRSRRRPPRSPAIANRLGQPRSSTHRLLSELVHLGLLVSGRDLQLHAQVRDSSAGARLRVAPATSCASPEPVMVRLRDSDRRERPPVRSPARYPRLRRGGRRGVRTAPLHGGRASAAVERRRLGQAVVGLRRSGHEGSGVPACGRNPGDAPRARPRRSRESARGDRRQPTGRCRSGSARRASPPRRSRSATMPAKSSPPSRSPARAPALTAERFEALRGQLAVGGDRDQPGARLGPGGDGRAGSRTRRTAGYAGSAPA